METEHLSLSPVKETVRRHWAGRAATFDEAPNHGLHSDAQRAAWQSRIQAWAGTEPIDALDVGCGTGFLALLLASLGHRVVGTDAADEMLERARAKADDAALAIEFQRADVERLPFEDGSFDLVVERHVIWTLPDPTAALAEWARVSRPGGRLILIEGHGSGGSKHADYETIRDALPLFGGKPASELAALVTSGGFAEVTPEPLMEEILWGTITAQQRYALHARKRP